MGVSAMPLSVAAHKAGSTNVGVTGPLESSLWSLDGERFVESIGAPFASHDIRWRDFQPCAHPKRDWQRVIDDCSHDLSNRVSGRGFNATGWYVCTSTHPPFQGWRSNSCQ